MGRLSSLPIHPAPRQAEMSSLLHTMCGFQLPSVLSQPCGSLAASFPSSHTSCLWTQACRPAMPSAPLRGGALRADPSWPLAPL
eukprot:7316217-Pyramimonas_sp.AAC.1